MYTRCMLLSLPLLAGCLPQHLMPPEPTTPQVVHNPFIEPQKALPRRVSFPPAAQETSTRVELIRGKLVGDNPQLGLRPNVTAIGAADPEIFHVGLDRIYITEGLVRQCQTDGQLAAVLAHELGRMVSERESFVSDQVRQPERLPPIHLPIGSNGTTDRDGLHSVEMARYEKAYPRQAARLPRPNPQQIARNILERAGYERTELDAAGPILQNAERYSLLENQFKGISKQSDWRTP